MNCPSCGADNPLGTAFCATCHSALLPPPPPPPGPGDPVEDLARETKRAARELVRLAAQLSRRVGDEAAAAAKDPSGSVHRVTRRAAKELDQAVREVDRVLKQL